MEDLPKGAFPSASTCWRRLRDWERLGIWLEVWRAFLAELDEQGRLSWQETFADRHVFPGKKKGAHASARPNAERVRSLSWWQTARVFLWECTLPRPHQMKSRLLKPRWSKWPYHGKGEGRPRKNPPRLIYDKAADSDPLRARLDNVRIIAQIEGQPLKLVRVICGRFTNTRTRSCHDDCKRFERWREVLGGYQD